MKSRSEECWESSEDANGSESALWAMAAGLFDLADATRYAARHLGTNDAATPMGAIEALSVSVKEIAEAINNHNDN